MVGSHWFPDQCVPSVAPVLGRVSGRWFCRFAVEGVDPYHFFVRKGLNPIGQSGSYLMSQSRVSTSLPFSSFSIFVLHILFLYICPACQPGFRRTIVSNVLFRFPLQFGFVYGGCHQILSRRLSPFRMRHRVPRTRHRFPCTVAGAPK